MKAKAVLKMILITSHLHLLTVKRSRAKHFAAAPFLFLF